MLENLQTFVKTIPFMISGIYNFLLVYCWNMLSVTRVHTLSQKCAMIDIIWDIFGLTNQSFHITWIIQKIQILPN